MLAYADGKEIEYQNGALKDWNITSVPTFNWGSNDFRIKPEPKCRPFKDAEECWREMQKHQPFGWVKSDDAGLVLIARLEETEYVENDFLIHFSDGNDCAKGMFQDFFFADGTPFGMLEESV